MLWYFVVHNIVHKDREKIYIQIRDFQQFMPDKKGLSMCQVPSPGDYSYSTLLDFNKRVNRSSWGAAPEDYTIGYEGINE